RLDPQAQRRLDPQGQGADVGPILDAAEAEAALQAAGVVYDRVDDPVAVAADALARGAIVGWAQGRLELGPRALGRRSVLADPRQAGIRERLNHAIKNREPFRPFGASLLEEALPAWFDLPPGTDATGPRRLMLLTYPV